MAGFWSSLSYLIIVVIWSVSGAEEPNTDGFFVSSFFEKMGFAVRNIFRDESPCSQEGIVFCGGGGRVKKLVAVGFKLSGEIPDTTIGKLGALEDLDLSNNSVTGFSSDFWGLGGTLRTLNLSRNAISGILPNDIGNMGTLRVLDLSHNNLTGGLPASFSSLLALRVLNLKGNAFEGAIPTGIVKLSFLGSLDLSSNRLSGRLPDGFAASLTNLTELNLAGNRIAGKGSDVLTGFKSIVYLNVSDNLFHGAVTEIFSLPSLQVVDVSRNRFQGHLFPGLPSSLMLLDVSENQLSGEISLVGRSLQHLNLARNRFSRQNFPPTLLELSALQFLNLSGTEITGNLPSGRQLANLTRLSVLDLSHNFLAGRIPDGLERLTGLNQLDFSWNNLSGDIPMALQKKLPNLQSFNFSFNPNLRICSSTSLPDSFPLSFVGLLTRICPLAVNPRIVPDTTSTPYRAKHRWLKLVIAIAFAGLCFLTGLLCLVLGCRKRRRRTFSVKQVSYREEMQNVSGPFSFRTDSTTWVADVRVATAVPVVMFEKPLLNFTFADLLVATSSFDRGTLLAEGKYGPVYRGVLPGGIHIALKVLVNSSSMTDEDAAAALESIGRIKHPNLVPLTGYCLAGEQRIAIYEFMEHGNLHRWLHDLPMGMQITEDWSADNWEEDDGCRPESIAMTWPFRHRVALGTARALAYLHHGCIPQIIHRDVKASSIYLDASLQPKLSDFGLARIVKPKVSSPASSAYLPPELNQSENNDDAATPKADVFGFGVLLFELITGRKPVGDEYSDRKDTDLVNWVRELVRKNDGSRGVDPKIARTGLIAQMVEGLRIGYLCTADLPSKRPSMQQVVGLLKDIEPNSDQ